VQTKRLLGAESDGFQRCNSMKGWLRMETRKKIKQRAFELYAMYGDKFSLSGICLSVGIKKPSLYFHFHSKEELIREVVEDEIEKYFFEINRENDNLQRIFIRLLEYYEDSQAKLLFWKRLLLFPPSTLEPELVARIENLTARRYEIVEGLIRQETAKGVIREGSQEEVALMYFSLLHGLLSSVLIYRPADIRRHYQGIWDRFWAGAADGAASP
jgi:AcrR family transcriptional regulator